MLILRFLVFAFLCCVVVNLTCPHVLKERSTFIFKVGAKIGMLCYPKITLCIHKLMTKWERWRRFRFMEIWNSLVWGLYVWVSQKLNNCDFIVMRYCGIYLCLLRKYYYVVRFCQWSGNCLKLEVFYHWFLIILLKLGCVFEVLYTSDSKKRVIYKILKYSVPPFNLLTLLRLYIQGVYFIYHLSLALLFCCTWQLPAEWAVLIQ